MKTVDSLSNFTIDLTPAIPYWDACETFDNLSDIIEYELWLEHHGVNIDLTSPIEEALDIIETHLPWLHQVAVNYVAEYLLARFR